MAIGKNKTIQAAVVRLLKPLVRLLLRQGVPYGVFADIAKHIYVNTAMEEFSIPGRKQSISRASVITGLSRKEVSRVTRLPEIEDQEIQDKYNRAVRVVSGWMRDADYTDDAGRPKTLLLEGEGATFARLTRKFSGDMPSRAILDELLQSGAVERLDTGKVRLTGPVFGPASGFDEKIAILGTDVRDLINTIDHNLSHSGTDSRFQLKTAYDNLPREAALNFRAAFPEKGLALLNAMDRELSTLDRDTNPASQGAGRIRAGIAVYYFEDDLTPPDGEEGR